MYCHSNVPPSAVYISFCRNIKITPLNLLNGPLFGLMLLSLLPSAVQYFNMTHMIYFQSEKVWVKTIEKQTVDWRKRTILLEMKQVVYIINENA